MHSSEELLLAGDDELRRIVAAHAIDGSGCACPYRIGVAAGLLSHNGYRPVRASRNRRARVKRRGSAKIQDEPCILRGAPERDSGSGLHAEWGIGLSMGNIGRG